jgi:hypothetical protein
MTEQIRRSIFETNSSSTHSLSISDGIGILDTIKPNEDNVIILTGGEFYWQWEKTNDTLTKANYCVQSFKNNEVLTKLLIETIEEHTQAKVKIEFESDSGIDHQSSDLIYKKISNNKEKLKEFIFSKDSWLYLGNDNNTIPPNFYDRPNLDYKYILEVEGVGKYLFVEIPNLDKIKDGLSLIMNQYLENTSFCDIDFLENLSFFEKQKQYVFEKHNCEFCRDNRINKLSSFSWLFKDKVAIFYASENYNTEGFSYFYLNGISSYNLYDIKRFNFNIKHIDGKKIDLRTIAIFQ